MNNHRFSQTVSIFHEMALPEEGMLLAGYAALIYAYDLHVPLPAILSAISSKHKKYETDEVAGFYAQTYAASYPSRASHLALKYEGVDLAVMSVLFAKIDEAEIALIVKNEPTGQYSRRIWFFYEWLSGKKIDLPDSRSGDYVDALDTSQQFGGMPRSSKRHRVRNNLLGTQNFCPLIRRTEKLASFMAMNLSTEAKTALGVVHPDILTRAAAFLLLKDSKASYAIEGRVRPITARSVGGGPWGRRDNPSLPLMSSCVFRLS